MKKSIVALALAALAQTALAAISGGAHDLSGAGPGGRYPGGTLSSCQYCHAPHRTNTSVADAPLWNRALPASNSFTAYTTVTDNTIVFSASGTLACLSCHDGVGDMGATFTGSKDNVVRRIGGNSYANIGTDLTNDHPVGVEYAPSRSALVAVNAINTLIKLYVVGGANQVECGSCHDPHGLSDAATGGLAFLRVPVAQICSNCHTK